jgi:hypothetical protein
VLVENGNETGTDGFFDHVVETHEHRAVDPVLAVHVLEGEEVDPHMAKAGLTDEPQMLHAEWRIDAALPQAVIAEDIDTATELGRNLEAAILCTAIARRQQAESQHKGHSPTAKEGCMCKACRAGWLTGSHERSAAGLADRR